MNHATWLGLNSTLTLGAGPISGAILVAAFLGDGFDRADRNRHTRS